jgi:hypothetical protein
MVLDRAPPWRQGRWPLEALTIRDGPHDRNARETLGVIDIFVTGKTTGHRLAKKPDEEMSGVPAAPRLQIGPLRPARSVQGRHPVHDHGTGPASDEMPLPWNFSLRRRSVRRKHRREDKSTRRGSNFASSIGYAMTEAQTLPQDIDSYI